MSTEVPAAQRPSPTVAEVAFPDGREGVFGVRDTSTVHAALVAFALSKMSLRVEPVPVIALGPDDDPDRVVVGQVVGAVRVSRLRELERDHSADPVAAHLEPAPPWVPAAATADSAVERLGEHEIALIVRDGAVIGVVTRAELTAALEPDGSGVG